MITRGVAMLLEEELQVVMRREIQLLRDILSNLKREQKALIYHDQNGLNDIFDERKNFLQIYEVAAQKLMSCAVDLALKHEIKPPQTHDEALDLFEELLSIEEIELRALCHQLLALIDEIQRQNSVTMYVIQSGTPRHELNPLQIRQEEKTKKVMLEVIDPEAYNGENASFEKTLS